MELHRLGTVELDDPRVEVVVADLTDWITTTARRFDAVCLDVDNGPGWLSVQGNAALYRADGLARLTDLLADGGVLAVWSAARAPSLEADLHARFDTVRHLEVPVLRGEPDAIDLARDPH